MKKIIPNIAVENCEEALEYYQQVFDGEIKNLQKADGIDMFKGHEGKIIHSELHINNDCIIYLTDIFGTKKESSNISLILQLNCEEEINQLYSTLKENGNVTFELQKTFWGSYHAVVTDCYGITWSLDYSVPEIAEELTNDFDIITFDEDIKVLSVTAESFPEGILAAHQKLHSLIPFSMERRYFGISRPEQGVIVYKAAAEELEKDNFEKRVFELFIIKQGRYIGIPILNFKNDPLSINKAFKKLTSNPDIDPNGYCIEWYYHDEDVKCLVRLKD